jgi:hypothetical protein
MKWRRDEVGQGWSGEREEVKRLLKGLELVGGRWKD